MALCESCGNTYDKTFQVTLHTGDTHVFDSFECAIHLLAPVCNHCGCRILGHGVESRGRIFCCVHCARETGIANLVDRTETPIASQASSATGATSTNQA
jgi:hypothetical protein